MTPSDSVPNDAPTCGKGLAEHALLPARVGELMAAVADVLEHHTAALDPADVLARRELAAYRSLVAGHRKIAAALQATAAEMEAYRDMPMAPHDTSVMTHPDGGRIFGRLVRLEEELLALVRDRLDRDHETLRQMT